MSESSQSSNSIPVRTVPRDQLYMNMEQLRVETLNDLNMLFRQKVQKTEDLEETERQIQYHRGFMDAFEKFQDLMKQIDDAHKIESVKKDRMLQIVSESQAIEEAKIGAQNILVSGDGSHD